MQNCYTDIIGDFHFLLAKREKCTRRMRSLAGRWRCKVVQHAFWRRSFWHLRLLLHFATRKILLWNNVVWQRNELRRLNLTLLVQIPHPTLEKVKFLSLGNALRVKFHTPRAQVMVKCQVFARGGGILKFWINGRIKGRVNNIDSLWVRLW